jgi:TnpA family transposase
MATVVQILPESAIKAYEEPPHLTAGKRKQLSYLNSSVQNYVDALNTPHNKLGFLLQYLYFRATGKFFSISSAHSKDIKMLSSKFKLLDVDLTRYYRSTSLRHREQICVFLGYQRLDDTVRESLRIRSDELCDKQIKPRLIFRNLLEYFHSHKIEALSYYSMAEIITNSLNTHQSKIVSNLNIELSESHKSVLGELLEPINPTEIKSVSLLRSLSTFNHIRQPKAIKENCNKLEDLRKRYETFSSIVKKLALSSGTVNYYAEVTLSLQLAQLRKREESHYLYLLCFIIHQKRIFQDRLMESLIDSVTKSESNCEKQEKDLVFDEFKRNSSQLNSLSKIASEHYRLVAKLTSLHDNSTLDISEKYLEFSTIIEGLVEPTQLEGKHHTGANEKITTHKVKRVEILQSHSIKLQKRVSEILKVITFDKESTSKDLYEAISYYKDKDGVIDKRAPLSFLDKDSAKIVVSKDDAFNVSLYKSYLFYAVKPGIQSGVLNLSDSYKFCPFDSYLIPEERWNLEREDLLDRAGLLNYLTVETELNRLKATLKNEYRKVRNRLENKENSHAKIDNSGKLILSTPSVDSEKVSDLSDFLPKIDSSLFEVLSTIDESTRFSQSFEHLHQKNSKKTPSISSILAGVIGYGCNIGIPRMGRLVRSVEKVDVDYATRWHFSVNNLHAANNKTLSLTEELQLSSAYSEEGEPRHTSSAGQKFSVSIESQDAGFSHKYFGTQKGVNVYSFIDVEHKLFHSTVITPSERETSYDIDGLLANEVVESEIHSTDTHGYSEVIFAVTHLMGDSFAPRIKSLKNQQLYSFETPSEANREARVLLSKGRIKTDLIESQWEEIMRFMTTIKLKKATVSQLFKRLSSYSRQHPLYRALKQFGRIVKTIFILRYVDDLELRQAIEKQLNRVESYHQFGKAIFFARNQEFNYATREEQLVGEGCKRLIANAIICWNFLYLSKKFVQQVLVRKKADCGCCKDWISGILASY